jgi:hypothetical protein
VPHPIQGSIFLGLLGLLFSPAKSVFLYFPLFVCSLSGLRRLIGKQAAIGVVIAACFSVQLIAVASFAFWAGEWAWGPRYLVPFMPLLCVTAPFATGWPQRAVTFLVGAGIIVQILAISVDHQRFYFEQGYPPYFWLDQSQMYRRSALLSRPAECYDMIVTDGAARARYFAPTPSGAFTDAVWGPATADLARGKQWVREYLVFMTWRPWPFWIRWIPEHQRPAFWLPLLVGSALGLSVSAALLLGLWRNRV